MVKSNNIVLSFEQKLFIGQAKQGKNILVNACIGSGKTTTIQYLCDVFPDNKHILYLTYNKLLKNDARTKITNNNVTVTNYHGFAFSSLKKMGVDASIADLIQTFLFHKPKIEKYDLLVLDEYQDIDTEIADLLVYIKEQNENIQILAVGDMDQKIYDRTTLDITTFIKNFLGDYIELKLTNCFRLSKEYAKLLGNVWNKQILGTNNKCSIQYMSKKQIIKFLKRQNPSDLLCLCKRDGMMSDVLNEIEDKYPKIYNKSTVYASIYEKDSIKSIDPNIDNAIFTTYDSSKGLEKKICIVFDFNKNYWKNRSEIPLQKYDILKNIFCVAASRGKEKIILVKDKLSKQLDLETLKTPFEEKVEFNSFNISEMFDFKYQEDIEKAYSMLKIEKIESNNKSIISIKKNDKLIDLSPCIGNFQEAMFFKKYSVDDAIKYYFIFDQSRKQFYDKNYKNKSIEEKILYLTSLETNQKRYIYQVDLPFINENQEKQIFNRLSTIFSENEEVQKECNIVVTTENGSKFDILGRCDVLKNNTVYELKFVSELSHQHFLQCACYIIGLKLNEGILWNTHDNSMYKIKIENKNDFINAVVKTITKRKIQNCSYSIKSIADKEYNFTENESDKLTSQYFAVIDTETNIYDEAMTVGVVIANSNNFTMVDSKYYGIEEAIKVGGMFSNEINHCSKKIQKSTRTKIIKIINELLQSYNVKDIFAYNASFDRNKLTELQNYNWFDIMKIARNKNYNRYIYKNNEEDFYSNGTLIRGYGLENILKAIIGPNYEESHNALGDVEDELFIIQKLNLPIKDYSISEIKNTNKKKYPKKKKSIYDGKIDPKSIKNVECVRLIDIDKVDINQLHMVVGQVGSVWEGEKRCEVVLVDNTYAVDIWMDKNFFERNSRLFQNDNKIAIKVVIKKKNEWTYYYAQKVYRITSQNEIDLSENNKLFIKNIDDNLKIQLKNELEKIDGCTDVICYDEKNKLYSYLTLNVFVDDKILNSLKNMIGEENYQFRKNTDK